MNTIGIISPPQSEVRAAHQLAYDAVFIEYYKGNLEIMREDFDFLGPWNFSKHHDLLVDHSGEDTAIKFMTDYNSYRSGTY